MYKQILKQGTASRAAIFLPYGRVKVAEATKTVPKGTR